MKKKAVRYHREKNVGVITLNRPERMNAWSLVSKNSRMRPKDCIVSAVWSVAKTRWPVTAARTALDAAEAERASMLAASQGAVEHRLREIGRAAQQHCSPRWSNEYEDYC